MKPKKLRFYAEGTGLVCDIEAQEHGIRRFVGRQFVEVPGEDGEPTRHGWASTGEAQEVPYRHEYVREAKHGHLQPADEATAKACGMTLKPRVAAKPEVHAEVQDATAPTTHQDAAPDAPEGV